MNLFDLLYGLGLGISAPYWWLRRPTRQKVLAALRQRMGHGLPPPGGAGPGILLHAVSLGEINATRALVADLRSAVPGVRFLITTTTVTGWDRARQLYDPAPDVTLLRYPLDFSAAIDRMLDGFRPDVAVLMELEVWPNFVEQCVRRRVPVILVNGRLTEPSFRRYQRLGPLSRRMFQRLSAVAAQEMAYAERFAALGVPGERLTVTGTMKFDTAEVASSVHGDQALASDLGIGLDQPLWVCGSTGPGEEALVLEVYRKLLDAHPRLRLAIVPRHPQRFDAVAELIQSAGFPLIRRSDRSSTATDSGAVILGDTMGELRRFYSLARVVFVGRSLVDLGPRQHGSDMIEPAALGKCVAVGPFTGNFAEVVGALRAADAIAVVPDAAALHDKLHDWLTRPTVADEIGRRAQQVVGAQRGATGRHARLIQQHLLKAHPHGPVPA